MPPINGGGGPGGDRGDHTVVPMIDHSDSPYAKAMPRTVDGTQFTGEGPLIPGFSIGPDGQNVCHEDGCE
jgi:hypothetical protein